MVKSHWEIDAKHIVAKTFKYNKLKYGSYLNIEKILILKHFAEVKCKFYFLFKFLEVVSHRGSI